MLSPLALAADLGITVSLAPSPVTWDPLTRTLYLQPVAGSLLAGRHSGVADLLGEPLEHELGHYAVATAAERAMPDWGMEPDTNRVGPQVEMVSQTFAGRVELVQRAVRRQGAMALADAQVVEAAVWLWQESRGAGLDAGSAAARLALGEGPRSDAARARFVSSTI